MYIYNIKISMNVQNNMKTFKELYLYLQLLKDSSIFPFLSENWKGKEKQESLFRLFSLLNLFYSMYFFHLLFVGRRRVAQALVIFQTNNKFK